MKYEDISDDFYSKSSELTDDLLLYLHYSGLNPIRILALTSKKFGTSKAELENRINSSSRLQPMREVLIKGQENFEALFDEIENLE